ncbi:hypothetical protein CCP4SC76_6240008 [Gammaproteobacteria bacterium]
MMNTITISGIIIRQNEQGFCCLDDIYKASRAKHRTPKIWLKRESTKKLIKGFWRELEIPLPVFIEGLFFAPPEVACWYAIWAGKGFDSFIHRALSRAVDKKDVSPIIQHEHRSLQ